MALFRTVAVGLPVVLLVFGGPAAQLDAEQDVTSRADAQGGGYFNGVDFVGPDGVVYPDFTYAGLPDGNQVPHVPVRITVDASGDDDHGTIERAIGQLPPEGGAVLLRDGIYEIDRSIQITADNVVVRGASRDKTVLKIVGGPGGGVFHFKGSHSNERRFFPKGFSRGDRVLDLAGSSGFMPEVGDYVALVVRGLPPDRQHRFKSTGNADHHPEYFGGIYKQEWYLDMLKVTGVDGDRISVSTPMKVQFNPAWSQVAAIRPIDPVVGGGIENLTIDNSQRLGGLDGVIFDNAAACWVRQVTIVKAASKPVYWGWVRGGKNVLVEDCLFDGVCHVGGGGNGYGGFETTYDCMFRRCEFRDHRHAPNMQQYASGNVFTECRFVNSNAEMHSDFARHNLIDHCQLVLGNSWAEACWKTKHLDNVGAGHDPTGGRHVLFNNDLDASEKGTCVYLGGLNYHTVIAYNRMVCGGTEQNDVIGSYTVQIFDFCDEALFIGNVFVNNRLDNSYYYKEYDGTVRQDKSQWAGVMFLPGYKSGRGTETDPAKYGQTGVAWAEDPVIPYTRHYAQHEPADNNARPLPQPPIWQGTGVTPKQQVDIHFIDNRWYGIAPEEGFKGYNKPATNRDNQFHRQIPEQLPRTKPFARSLYQWQMQLKRKQSMESAQPPADNARSAQ